MAAGEYHGLFKRICFLIKTRRTSHAVDPAASWNDLFMLELFPATTREKKNTAMNQLGWGCSSFCHQTQHIHSQRFAIGSLPSPTNQTQKKLMNPRKQQISWKTQMFPRILLIPTQPSRHHDPIPTHPNPPKRGVRSVQECGESFAPEMQVHWWLLFKRSFMDVWSHARFFPIFATTCRHCFSMKWNKSVEKKRLEIILHSSRKKNVPPGFEGFCHCFLWKQRSQPTYYRNTIEIVVQILVSPCVSKLLFQSFENPLCRMP